MHSPAHIMASLFVWRRFEAASLVSAVLSGAVIPDAPMFLFFVIVRGAGYSGKQIWGQLYFDIGWQYFFDVFNSAPLFMVLAFLAWRMRNRWWLPLLEARYCISRVIFPCTTTMLTGTFFRCPISG